MNLETDSQTKESPTGKSQAEETQAGVSQATTSQAFNRTQKSAKIIRRGEHSCRYQFSCNSVQEQRHFIQTSFYF